jgi:hypothetical protein
MRGAQAERDPDRCRDHPRRQLLLVKQPGQRVILWSGLQQSKKRKHDH